MLGQGKAALDGSHVKFGRFDKQVFMVRHEDEGMQSRATCAYIDMNPVAAGLGCGTRRKGQTRDLDVVMVVNDTSPIRALAHLDLLDLLEQIFSGVLIPPAVEQELRHPPRQIAAVDVAVYSFIHVQAPLDASQVQLFLRWAMPVGPRIDQPRSAS